MDFARISKSAFAALKECSKSILRPLHQFSLAEAQIPGQRYCSLEKMPLDSIHWQKKMPPLRLFPEIQFSSVTRKLYVIRSNDVVLKVSRVGSVIDS